MTVFDGDDRGRVSGAQLVDQLRAEGKLDALFEQIDAGQVALTGDGGFVPALVKAALERGLQAELTGHLGYAKHDPAGRGSGNSRNGTSSKTFQSEIGPIQLDVPRDRAGTFRSRLLPVGQRRLGGLDDMIISLYAGGMTIRVGPDTTWPARSARSCRTRRSRTSPTRSRRRCWPGRPDRWKRSTR